MTQIRLTVEKFARDVEGALADLSPGDEVLLERDGEVVARLRTEPRYTDWAKFFSELSKVPPLDDEFEKNVLEAIAERNKPSEGIDWEF